MDDYIFDENLILIGEDGAKWESGEEAKVENEVKKEETKPWPTFWKTEYEKAKEDPQAADFN